MLVAVHASDDEQVVRRDQRSHRGEREQEPAEVARRARLAGEVAARVTRDQGADAAHEHEHHGTRQVEAHAEGGSASTERRSRGHREGEPEGRAGDGGRGPGPEQRGGGDQRGHGERNGVRGGGEGGTELHARKSRRVRTFEKEHKCAHIVLEYRTMPTVEQINFHHLRYFWAVAREGNLTRTAARLRVAPSALSSQIQQLEAQLGEALFRREGRGLALTEAGKIALAYADEIFRAGGELLATLEHGRRTEQGLRIGAVGTLSRNFQESFVRPLLDVPDVRLSLETGALDDLLVRLESHALDLILANRPPSREPGRRLRSRRLARQPVSIVGPKRRRGFRFPQSLHTAPMIVPGPASDVRSEFDALCEQRGVRVRILAEVDDMATMRLIARDANALALVPSIVVRDELRDGALHEHCVVPDLFESFYAITVERAFQHPLLASLLKRNQDELLDPEPI
jgi:LysR family transcriptional regulator, transcriptional activator of nhaA